MINILENIKYYIIGLFVILLFFVASQTIFANNYGQEYRNDISKTGISVENVDLFGFEVGQNEIENGAGLKSEFGQECENVGKVFSIATKGGGFGEKLFLSEKFGITSKRFANSITGVKGTWNNQGGLFKMGWSTQSKYGGGMQLRIGIGSKVGKPNQAWKHIYVPKTFVPNSFANPSIQVKQSLFKLYYNHGVFR